MHGMAEEVDFGLADKRTSVRFMYFTNEQAVSVPEENMSKVCTALKIKDKFSMVIRIMPCQMGNTWWKALPYSQQRFPEKRTPEPDEVTAELTEHQLLLLAKEIILPHAMSCKALVLGQEGCSLTAAFLKVASRFMQERGSRCPFRILVMGRAYAFHVATKSRKSVAFNFWKRTKNWSDKLRQFESAMSTRFGSDPAYWPQADLPTGTYTMIMFECLDAKGHICEKALHGFQHDFISSLMDDVPVLALATFGMERMNFVPTMSDHVNRGMPLVLIDSRRRQPAAPLTFKELEAELEELREALHKANVADWYSTSALAYVRSFCDRLRGAPTSVAAADDQRRMWIHEAITQCRIREAREREFEKDLQARRGRAMMTARPTSPAAANTSSPTAPVATPTKAKLQVTAAKTSEMTQILSKATPVPSVPDRDPFDDSTLVKATDVVMGYIGGELEWEMRTRHDRCENALKAIEATQSFEELARVVEEQWMSIRGCCFHKREPMERFAREHLWCELRDEGDDPSPRWRYGRWRLVVNPQKVPAPSDTGALSFVQAKDAFLEMVRGVFDVAQGMDLEKLSRRAFVLEDSKWMAVYDILNSKHVTVSSLHDLKDCRRKLSRLSVMNNLPEENTLEGLVLLRTAWNLVEQYDLNSKYYDRISIVFYFTLLIFEMGMIVLVTIRSGSETLGDLFQRQYWVQHTERILLGLALACSLITGFTSIVSPVRKWTRLKAAALRMESEIWKFRTRLGDYRIEEAFMIGQLTAEREAEKRFAENIGHIVDYVKSSAGMNRSAFFATSTTTPDTSINIEDEKANAPYKLDGLAAAKIRASKTTFIHGQRDLGQKPPRLSEDNHHSPECPDHFVHFRLVPARDMIQKKIPQLARLYSLLQAFLLCSTIVNTGLTATTDGTLTAILAAGSGFVTAWQEFLSVEFRLDSYSAIAKKLDDLILWWQALPDEDKRVHKNIDHLVMTTESQLQLMVPNAPGGSEGELRAKGQSLDGKKAEARVDIGG